MEKIGGRTEYLLKPRGVDGMKILKWDWNRHELDSSGSIQRNLAGCGQYEYELSNETKDREFLDCLMNFYLLNKGFPT